MKIKGIYQSILMNAFCLFLKPLISKIFSKTITNNENVLEKGELQINAKNTIISHYCLEYF